MTLSLLTKLVVPVFEWMALTTYFICIRHPAPRWRLIVTDIAAIPVFLATSFLMANEPYTDRFPLGPLVTAVCDFLLLWAGTGHTWKASIYVATHTFTHTEATISFAYAMAVSGLMAPVYHTMWRPIILIAIGIVLNILGVIVEGIAFRGNTLEHVGWLSITIAFCLSIAGLLVANNTTATSLRFFSESDPDTFGQLSNAFYLRTLTILFTGSVMYMQQIYRRNILLDAEKQNLEKTAADERRQYLELKKNLDEIHRLSHDLKHYVMVFEGPDAGAVATNSSPTTTSRPAKSATADASAMLRQFQDDIDSASTLTQTGNAVLDTVINGEQRKCARLGVHLIVMADGTALSGLQALDITSLVGNMLDNAIEASARLKDDERKIIHFSVERRGGFVVLHCDNSFDPSNLRHSPTGTLLTSKTNEPGKHGFGIRSIKHIAEKYDGNAQESADTRRGVFSMDVLLPGSVADTRDDHRDN
jgi:hypothetical protein